MQQSPTKYFGLAKSLRVFCQLAIAKEVFLNEAEACGWDFKTCKVLMKHPDCPIEINEHFAGSKLWYERLVAFCSRTHRKSFFERAIKDSKSTVRKAAYQGAIDWKLGKPNGGWLDDETVRQMVLRDDRIHSYFNKKWLSGDFSDFQLSEDLPGSY